MWRWWQLRWVPPSSLLTEGSCKVSCIWVTTAALAPPLAHLQCLPRMPGTHHTNLRHGAHDLACMQVAESVPILAACLMLAKEVVEAADMVVANHVRWV